MSVSWIGIAIELVVAVLLAITIGYCMLLNARLKRLRADEAQLRQTIFDLVRATESAERAISDLRLAAQECDKTLAKRLREAEYFSVEIQREIGEGEQVLARIMQIAKIDRGAGVARSSALPPLVSGVAETVGAPPRIGALKLKFAESAERLAGLRRRSDSEAA